MRKPLAAVLALAALLATACATADEARMGAGAPELPMGSVQAAEAAAREVAGGQQIGGTLRLMGVLSGEQLAVYLSTLAPLERATGIVIEYETAGDLQAVLQARTDGGNPPDVVSNPSAGQVRDLAEAGDLVPLDPWLDMAAVRTAYPESLRQLASVGGRLYGLPVNTAVQGLVWYAVPSYDGPVPPADWAQLTAWTDRTAQDGRTPWCLGIESGPSSGWPGAVWIEQFVLQQGVDVYDAWWQGRLPWTAPEVRTAFASFGRIATDGTQVNGGPTAVLTANFAESPKGLFASPPACALHVQGDWLGNAMTTAFPNVEPVADIDFFPFPAASADRPQPLETTGETLAAFRDTPQARVLARYVATSEFSALVAATGSWLGANRQTPPEAYPSELSRRVAQLYAGAPEVRFGAKDAMPTAVSQAFLQAVVAYVDDPGSLDAILADLERARAEAF
jgi:alpha-glucoside transport system substrate-binding protein